MKHNWVGIVGLTTNVITIATIISILWRKHTIIISICAIVLIILIMVVNPYNLIRSKP